VVWGVGAWEGAWEGPWEGVWVVVVVVREGSRAPDCDG